ncbi:RNA polymerase sigma factor [Pedobacter sp. AW31-3R]|uniref:RNA polymerase sigma factor n=1 Tax=Pedobacter sp. AW31-3R TaxID=3445781 RepID=UPI003FA06600
MIRTIHTPSASSLLASLKKGDHLAMEYLYQKYWEDVLDNAYKRLRDEEIAQDITQEIFISVWENRERLNIEGSIEAYFKGAVKYKVINYFKSAMVREKHKEDIALLTSNQSSSSAENMLMLKDLHKQFDDALEELPEKMRVIISMSRKQEKSIQEIAEELNLSAQTVKNQISSALKLIREKLAYTLILIICLLLT